ncbi:MAG: secreted hydrolase, partial [Mycobacterium sp.]
CASLQLDLIADPLVAAPAHALPIEYMEGPYRYRGTLRGKPVSGFGLYERSLALYRDWELIDVLAAGVAELQTSAERLTTLVDRVRVLTVSGRRGEALQVLQTEVRPAVERMPAGRGAGVATVVDDLVTALGSRR